MLGSLVLENVGSMGVANYHAYTNASKNKRLVTVFNSPKPPTHIAPLSNLFIKAWQNRQATILTKVKLQLIIVYSPKLIPERDPDCPMTLPLTETYSRS